MIKRRVSTFWACLHHWPISERGASAQYGEGGGRIPGALLSGLSTPRPGGGDSAGGETVR